MCSTCRYNLSGVSESPYKHLDGIPIRKALFFHTEEILNIFFCVYKTLSPKKIKNTQNNNNNT